MRIAKGEEEQHALEFITAAAKVAQQATCERSKCGSVIVKRKLILASGYNSPPGNLESQRRCSLAKSDYDAKVTDKTCCIHAEQRAILTALKKCDGLVAGSSLYFARLDNQGNLQPSGEPYCTLCSKLALDVGLKDFILYKPEGIAIYDTQEYNKLSYVFGRKGKIGKQ